MAGCGYHLGRGASSYPQIRTIAVPVFSNATFEPALEQAVTLAVKEAFIRDGRWRLVDHPESADATISGQILSFDRAPLSFSVERVVTQYRVTLRVDLSLVERATGKILWRESGITGRAEYFLTSDIAQTRSAEDRAIREASNSLAETAAGRIIEGF